MKKVKGIKKMKHDLPDDVGGANGEVNIVESFCTVYEELYNSSESSEAMSVLKDQLNDMIQGSDTSGHEVDKITGAIVKEAACKMKAGKGELVMDILVMPSSMHLTSSLINFTWSTDLGLCMELSH